MLYAALWITTTIRCSDLAGEQVVEHGPGRVDVRVRPHLLLLSGRLLGRHVRRRPHHVPVHGDQRDPHIDRIESVIGQNAGEGQPPAGMIDDLKTMMWTKVGMFRNGDDLDDALATIRAMRRTGLRSLAVSAETVQNTSVVEWFELRNGLLAVEALTVAALNRRESRGAHQRDDFSETLDAYQRSQRISLENDETTSSFSEERR